MNKKRQPAERRENEFSISEGNMMVLKTIPDMMADETYRVKLRQLAFEFKIDTRYKSR